MEVPETTTGTPKSPSPRRPGWFTISSVLAAMFVFLFALAMIAGFDPMGPLSRNATDPRPKYSRMTELPTRKILREELVGKTAESAVEAFGKPQRVRKTYAPDGTERELWYYGSLARDFSRDRPDRWTIFEVDANGTVVDVSFER